jgi:hypothetical protein
MEHTEIFLQFDPDLHPLGHALAIELLDESPYTAPGVGRSKILPGHADNRFGWEFDIRAA